MASKENRPRTDQQSETPRGIPDNPWVDDVGMLRDRKAHFEVDRLITCNCLNCGNKAKGHIETSFTGAFGKNMAEETGVTLYKLYEGFIQLSRNAKKEISPQSDPKVVFGE